MGVPAAVQRAEHLREAASNIRLSLGGERYLGATASPGVAADKGHPDFNHLIQAADQNRYEVKNAGRNCVRDESSSAHQP
ncbi:MAG: GGDEF domain-containing protein [Halothiobacillus sp.]